MGSIDFEYGRYIRLKKDDHLRYLKQSPFYGKLFFILDESKLIVCHTEELHKIIKKDWFVTAKVNNCSAGRYQIQSVYYSDNMREWRFATDGLGGAYGSSTLVLSAGEIMEYFPTNPGTRLIDVYTFPDAPPSPTTFSSDYFEKEFLKIDKNPKRYLTSAGLMGLKLIYKNMEYSDRVKCYDKMTYILISGKNVGLPDFTRLDK